MVGGNSNSLDIIVFECSDSAEYGTDWDSIMMSIRKCKTFFGASVNCTRNTGASDSKYSKRTNEKVPDTPPKTDSALIRILGSDWADRRGQPLSPAMKLYWGIFTIVITSGLYTHWNGLPGSMSFACCIVEKPH